METHMLHQINPSKKQGFPFCKACSRRILKLVTKPKKQKLTKEEKLALKLAEEERIRLEEERLRKEAEEEAKRKAEEERLRQLELERIRLEEESIRKEEYRKLSEVFAIVAEAYKKDLEVQWKKSQWNQYVNVWKVMNPFSLPMVNTFLSKWDEEESCDLKKFFASYKQCMEIIRELEAALLNSPELTQNTMKLWNEILTNVKRMIGRKLDFLTFHLLTNGADYLSPDSYNMEHCITDAHYDDIETGTPLTLGICVWVNFAKNVRYKGMEFPDLGFCFQLPNSLVTQLCAVRILYTSFDDLMSNGTDTKTRLPKEQEQNRDTEQPTGIDEEFSTLANDSAAAIENKISLGVELNSVKSIESEPPTSEADETSPSFSSSENLPATDTSTIVSKNETVASISAISVHVTPSVSESGKTAVIKFPIPEEPELTFVDKSLYFHSGDTFHIDLMEVPIQPVVVGAWCMMVSQDTVLKKIPYKAFIVPTRKSRSDMSALVAAEFAHFEISRYEKEITHAISISLRLPETVVYVERPLPAFWLEEEKAFVMNGIFDVRLDDANEMLSFKTNQFGKFALLQRIHSNLPYRLWQLVVDEDKKSAILAIKGAILDIELQISEKGCCIFMICSNGKKVLEDLYLHFMTPAELIEKLLSVGINIKFDETGLQNAGFQPKNQLVEQWIYACMSILTNTFSFSSSPWNSFSEKCIFRITKINDTLKESFLVIVDEERALRLESSDDNQPFSDECCPGQKFHSDLYQLLMNEAKEPLYQEHKSIHVHFSINLRLLLDSCRILSCL